MSFSQLTRCRHALSARLSACFESDFVRNSISGSTATILEFIFTPISEIKNHEKNSLAPKKIIFKARFSFSK